MFENKLGTRRYREQKLGKRHFVPISVFASTLMSNSRELLNESFVTRSDKKQMFAWTFLTIFVCSIHSRSYDRISWNAVYDHAKRLIWLP